jgi:hypothetical protein
LEVFLLYSVLPAMLFDIVCVSFIMVYTWKKSHAKRSAVVEDWTILVPYTSFPVLSLPLQCIFL